MLSSFLTDLGIRKGSVLMAHTGMSGIESISGTADLFQNMKDLDSTLTAKLGDSGTLLIPTFSYSFCNNKPFNPLRTGSRVGMFSNYFMKAESTQRSTHPIFSFAARGALAGKIVQNVSEDSFGWDSAFDRAGSLDTDIAFIGCDFNSCTFVHHIEQKFNADYRYLKEFKGNIIRDGKTTPSRATFFVRDLERNVENNFRTIGQELLDLKIMKSLTHGDFTAYLVNARDLFNYAWHRMLSDPYVFLESTPSRRAL